MMTPQQIVDTMTKQQRKVAADSLGDALDIISEIVGSMPYSSLFNLTIAALEIIEDRRL